MAAILSNTKPHSHARSISLPSISGHQEPEFIHLNRIQASKEATTSTSLMCGRLNRLNDVYGSIEPLLALQATKSSFVHRHNKLEQLNKSLDEIVGLLDLCATTKDVLSMSMDASKELQSVLRRKRHDHQNLTTYSLFEEYLSQRKVVKKTVCKALSGLQKQTKEDHKITSDINVLKEMRLDTLTMFESVLAFFLGSEAELKQKGWFLFSKMVGYKRVQFDQTTDDEESEVKKVDDVIRTIISCKNPKSGGLEVDTIQTGLAKIDMQLLDLDEQVDRLSRNLIKNRVSILNFLNF